MNRFIVWIFCISFMVVAAGCGVSKDEYEAIKAERDALEDELSLVQHENQVVKSEIMDLYREQNQYEAQINECRQNLKKVEQGLQSGEESATAPKSSAAAYTVKPGDTLYKVAEQTGVDMATLTRLNKINGEVIYVGQKLRLK